MFVDDIVFSDYLQFREIDNQIANTKTNINTQMSERQRRQQTEHLNKLEQEREALVQQCLTTSQARRMPATHAGHQQQSQFFAFDEQDVEAHERSKKARLELDASKLGRFEYQNWEAYSHGTFPTPENHSVAGMASFGSLSSAHPHEWVRFHQMPGVHDGLSQPNSPTHLLSASLNTMSLQPAMAAAAAAAAGYPHMMPSPAGSTASAGAPGREADVMPPAHRSQSIGSLPMGPFTHDAQFGGSQTGYPSGPSAWPSAGPASAGMESMHSLHGRTPQPVQRTASAPDVLRYSGAQGGYGPRGGMSAHQQYPPYSATQLDAARFHGYNRGTASGFGMYDQHHQQHGYMPQAGSSYARDAHFLNTQPWHRR